MLGNLLQGRDQQYVASKDDKNTWRILDTWHDALKSAQVEDEIPDDSPAVCVITEGEFIALIKEAARTGILENATFGTGEAEHEAALLDKSQEVQKLREDMLTKDLEIEKLQKRINSTEDYVLKERAMESILKLAAMSDVSNLTTNTE
tara:strand:- start:1060 stop:1503 length:444 start_codon:yes stop_codon:yes gene_type:complete